VNRAGGPADLRALRRAKLVSVPPAMVEASARRRAGGDWRGACTVSNVDVEADPALASRIAGSAARERLVDGPVTPAVSGGAALQAVRRFPRPVRRAVAGVLPLKSVVPGG
jgi:hypothetical protein